MELNSFKEEKRKVNALADQGKMEEALAQCDALHAQHPEWRVEIIRLRAYTYTRQGMYQEAIAEREALISSTGGTLRDYYQLGDNFLSAGRFDEASRWLEDVLRVGAEQKEPWFESAALLLLAYAQMRLGRLQLATSYLDRAVAVDPECAMPVGGEGVLTHQELRAKINERVTRG